MGMKMKKLVAYAALCAVLSLGALAQTTNSSNAGSAQMSQERDGQHDFDPLIGSWKFHLRKLMKPLTGSNDWVEFEGTGVCYKLWDGRSNLDTVELDSPAGHIEGVTLRLYNPQTHEWRLYWANQKIGILDVPQIGKFDKNGHGEFYAQDTINGKTVIVKFDWSRMNTDSPHFEQSFSPDGGKTWEVNWITDQTRMP